MIRKLFKSIFLLFMFMVPTLVSASTVLIDGIYYNLINKVKIAEVIQNPDLLYTGDVVIPPSVTYNGVTYSVTSIGDNAFYNCTGLTSITIPQSVTKIGYSVFSRCTNLTDANIIVTDFPAFCNEGPTFAGKGNMSVHLLDEEGNEMTEFVIPDDVTSIREGLFYNCKSLSSVTIPNSVTTIGWDAFQNCGSLHSITIPDDVTSIGGYAFSYCWRLSSINIPNKVTDIGESAFERCYGLTSIEIPNSVTSIGEGAFYNCIGLTSVTLLCKEIGSWFSYLKSIREVILGDEVETIGSYAFRACTGLTSITFPQSVTSIGFWSFEGCTALTTVTIGSHVKKFNTAFENCSSLKNFYVIVDDYSAFSTNNGFLKRLPGPIHLLDVDGDEITEFVVPEGVTSISNGAFRRCKFLTSVTMPNSVTTIDYWAFVDCISLMSVTFGSKINEIKAGAFENCPELADVYCFAEQVPKADISTFKDSYIDHSTLHVPAGSVSAYQQEEPWKDFESIVAIEPSIIPGDANKDKQVNVTDIVAMVNYIMNKPSTDFDFDAADVNEDGEVNVTDIVATVNIIMKGDN